MLDIGYRVLHTVYSSMIELTKEFVGLIKRAEFYYPTAQNDYNVAHNLALGTIS